VLEASERESLSFKIELTVKPGTLKLSLALLRAHLRESSIAESEIA
jgi:hypothetical protein